MAKIVFFCIPAQGHVNPTLAVVKELTNRGHQVWYYCYNALRERIEATGATFVPCDEFDAELRLSPKEAARLGNDLALSTRVLTDTTMALDDTVCRHMEQIQPDCIVADSMAVWGKAVALKLGIPFVSSTTTFAFNQHSAKLMKQSPMQLLSLLLSMPKINKCIKRFQAKGYPINSVLDIIQNDDNTHTIVYTSPEFQPCSETFSDKFVFVGPSIRPAESKFGKTREKLIYISMGTVNNAMLPLYKRCIDAFRDTDYQVVMSVGQQIALEDFGVLPENVQIFPFVDQMAVLQKADAFISHCGMNSASEALYYGVPLVMLPQTNEQGAVAERTAQLGAGIKLCKTDPASIRAAVNQVLSDRNYQKSAAVISDNFQSCTGAKGAADKIEAVILSF